MQLKFLAPYRGRRGKVFTFNGDEQEFIDEAWLFFSVHSSFVGIFSFFVTNHDEGPHLQIHL
jgi:hypothetical protein